MYLLFQVSFEVVMRDSDELSISDDDEIDTFDITVNFPSDNQEHVFTGNRGIANITLTYNLTCIEPDTCKTTVASSELIGTCTCMYIYFTYFTLKVTNRCSYSVLYCIRAVRRKFQPIWPSKPHPSTHPFIIVFTRVTQYARSRRR